MPCSCDGYPDPRPQNLREQVISLGRHHAAVEAEVEAWREIIPHVREAVRKLQEIFPGAEFPELPPTPGATPPWRPQTYFRSDGTFPSDIRETIETRGWLEPGDFLDLERAQYERLKAKYEVADTDDTG